MDRYKELTDEQLLERLRAGETAVMDYILEKYKNLVRKRVKDLHLLGGDGEDLIQEGMIGLFKAVQDYEPDRQTSFYTFADLCISRQIYTAVRTSNRKKHMPLNTYISLYSTTGGAHSDLEEQPLIEQLHSLHADSPEALLIERERVDDIRRSLLEKLSRFEREVMLLFLAGYDYRQIAAMVDRPAKSVDNALQRSRTKLAEAGLEDGKYKM